jgi:hypothetical protein
VSTITALVAHLPTGIVPILMILGSGFQTGGAWLLYHFATIGFDIIDANTAAKRQWGFRCLLIGSALDLCGGLIWYFTPAKWG